MPDADEDLRRNAERELRRLANLPLGDNPTETEITREIARDTLGAVQRGQGFPPALIARIYRGFTGEAGMGEAMRRGLHEAAAAGSESAAAILTLLSDDPWWRETED